MGFVSRVGSGLTAAYNAVMNSDQNNNYTPLFGVRRSNRSLIPGQTLPEGYEEHAGVITGAYRGLDRVAQTINSSDFLTGEWGHFAASTDAPEPRDQTVIDRMTSDDVPFRERMRNRLTLFKESCLRDKQDLTNALKFGFNAGQKASRAAAQATLYVTGALDRNKILHILVGTPLAAAIRVAGVAFSAITALTAFAVTLALGVVRFGLKAIRWILNVPVPLIPLIAIALRFIFNIDLSVYLPHLFIPKIRISLPSFNLKIFIPTRIFWANVLRYVVTTAVVMPLAAAVYVTWDIGICGIARQVLLGVGRGIFEEQGRIEETTEDIEGMKETIERHLNSKGVLVLNSQAITQPIFESKMKLTWYKNNVLKPRFSFVGYWKDQWFGKLDQTKIIRGTRQKITVKVGAKSDAQNLVKLFLNFCNWIEGSKTRYEIRTRRKDDTLNRLSAAARLQARGIMSKRCSELLGQSRAGADEQLDEETRGSLDPSAGQSGVSLRQVHSMSSLSSASGAGAMV